MFIISCSSQPDMCTGFAPVGLSSARCVTNQLQDAAFEAALDADEAGDVEGLVADLAQLSAIPAVEYSAAMFPEDADLELFENLLDATQNYMGAWIVRLACSVMVVSGSQLLPKKHAA